ncbi:MAG: glycosyltransferase family 1 protein [Caulobacteraceae bacterium]|nr:glycosyltransferase family 1 protein [Caulobacteraceae bacterium]
MTLICIDGHNLSLPHGSGIATYSRSLLAAVEATGARKGIVHGPPAAVPAQPLLREVMVNDARIRVRALTLGRPNRRVQAALAPFGKRARPVSPSGKVLWPDHGATPDADVFWLSTDLFRIANRAFSDYRILTPLDLRPSEFGRPDLMHWTYPAPVHARGVPNIYTVHDLIPLRLPHTTLDDKKRFLDLCHAVARRADHIVTVSETTRRDMISLLGVEEDRITSTWQPTHLPPGALDRSEAEVAASVEDVFGLGWKEYFVFFGAIEPKKNVGRLVEAYLRSGVKTPLVVVGGRGWLEEHETGLLDEVLANGGSPAASRLRRYEFLPRPLLIDLLRGARATLFPSLYEGFGLPVLESMMLGTPVLASNAGSLPEIAGSATLQVDPYDVDAMAGAIRTLNADDDLRADLTARGQERAGHFTPEVFEGRMADLYRRLGVTG